MPRLLLLLLIALIQISGAEYLTQHPALNATEIVFSYAGRLWSVARQGGEAKRLTKGTDVESYPVFSPDGTQIAFAGEHNGNTDVYVIPAAGGTPRRLTYHPASDWAAGWSPDGKQVLFSSGRASATDGHKLFTVPVEGGFPEEVPLPIAEAGSYSPDGSHLAYEPIMVFQDAWKRYRGGQTRKIWIAGLADSSVVEIPRDNSNDFNPMWVREKVYFLSDRNGPVTLFSYDTRTRQVKQLIENHGLDFKSASAGPGAIVYEQFGSLHLYDLESGKTQAVEVSLPDNLPETRPRTINVAKRLRNPDLSPDGTRAVFEARGEIIVVSAKNLTARNLTRTPGVRERDPAWSPDGNKIAYFSDESGEYALHLRDPDGAGPVKKISLGENPAFYFAPRWSPDSRKIAYLDNHRGIWYIDLEQRKPVLVDKDYYTSDQDRAPAWSPDSKWLAYRKQLKNHLDAICFYSLAEGKSTQVTDGLSDARHPVFDKSGKYLFFTASTDSGPAMQPDVGSFSRQVSSTVYLMVLSKEQRSPLAPVREKKKGRFDKFFRRFRRTTAPKDKNRNYNTTVKIDFEDILERVVPVPMEPKNYTELMAGRAGTLYALEGGEPRAIHTCNLSRSGIVIVSGFSNFRVSFSGDKALYQSGDRWEIGALPWAGPRSKRKLKTARLEVPVDPPAEWKQMYHEAWRLERDFFYDPNYHGVDLQAAEKRYQPFLENLDSRRDLNYLFAEMLGELTVSHLRLGGGDSPETKNVETGLLGADYQIENGRYRFARIYDGENWNPDLNAPLRQPGATVAAGQYLLAVDGRELRAADNIYGFFEGKTGKPVALKVGADPSGAGAREVLIAPVADEGDLRKAAWIEGNRRKVDELSHGRVAYIYMADTGAGGYASFNRYFFAQLGREAVILDERFNHGGHFATDIIEYLKRPMMSLMTFRDGADWVQPQGAIFGPKVMIINEYCGSGGDSMPWYFRRAGVGKLIGTRTWGGVAGLISPFPDLMDGGTVSAPVTVMWNPNGQYDVENRGVAPDIEVPLDPRAVRQGHDPQLEKAVEVVMRELPENPGPLPQRPAFPNYHAK